MFIAYFFASLLVAACLSYLGSMSCSRHKWPLTELVLQTVTCALLFPIFLSTFFWVPHLFAAFLGIAVGWKVIGVSLVLLLIALLIQLNRLLLHFSSVHAYHEALERENAGWKASEQAQRNSTPRIDLRKKADS